MKHTEEFLLIKGDRVIGVEEREVESFEKLKAEHEELKRVHHHMMTTPLCVLYSEYINMKERIEQYERGNVIRRKTAEG